MFLHVSRAKVPVRTYALCLELMQNNMMQLHFVSLSAKLNCIIISLSPAKNCAQTATSALLMFGNLLSHSRLIICQSLESFTAVTKSLGVLVLLLWDIFLFARTQGCIQHRYFTQIFFYMGCDRLDAFYRSGKPSPKRTALSDSSPFKYFNENLKKKIIKEPKMVLKEERDSVKYLISARL